MELILRRMLTVLSDDPRIRILKLLAEAPTSDTYVSFRTIARRIGVNYTKLRHYLSQLEAVGLIDSIKIRTTSDNYNKKSNNKGGYTYYRLRQEARDLMRKILSNEMVSTYYLYYIFFTALAVITACM